MSRSRDFGMGKRGTDNDSLEAVFRRMGEPSWLILGVLHPTRGQPGIAIIREVEDVLRRAEYPYQRLDPSTLHYALKRMEDDGLVERRGEEVVDVPGPHGTTRQDTRPVYVITGHGSVVLARRRQLDRIVAGAPSPAFGGVGGVGGGG